MTELENILNLIASDKIEFKFNDEILDENQIKNVTINTNTSSKKTKLRKSNRGFAKKIKQGVFLQSLPSVESSYVNLSMIWDKVEVNLLIDKNGCRIFSKTSDYFF